KYLLLSNPNSYFFPDSPQHSLLIGNVLLSVNNDIKIKSAYLHLVQTKLIKKNNVEINRSESVLISKSLLGYLLNQDKKPTKFEPGSHAFPFDIKIPTNIPPSSDSEFKNVFYTVKAIINRSNNFNNTIIATTPINVISYSSINVSINPGSSLSSYRLSTSPSPSSAITTTYSPPSPTPRLSYDSIDLQPRQSSSSNNRPISQISPSISNSHKSIVNIVYNKSLNSYENNDRLITFPFDISDSLKLSLSTNKFFDKFNKHLSIKLNASYSHHHNPNISQPNPPPSSQSPNNININQPESNTNLQKINGSISNIDLEKIKTSNSDADIINNDSTTPPGFFTVSLYLIEYSLHSDPNYNPVKPSKKIIFQKSINISNPEYASSHSFIPASSSVGQVSQKHDLCSLDESGNQPPSNKKLSSSLLHLPTINEENSSVLKSLSINTNNLSTFTNVTHSQKPDTASSILSTQLSSLFFSDMQISPSKPDTSDFSVPSSIEVSPSDELNFESLFPEKNSSKSLLKKSSSSSSSSSSKNSKKNASSESLNTRLDTLDITMLNLSKSLNHLSQSMDNLNTKIKTINKSIVSQDSPTSSPLKQASNPTNHTNLESSNYNPNKSTLISSNPDFHNSLLNYSITSSSKSPVNFTLSTTTTTTTPETTDISYTHISSSSSSKSLVSFGIDHNKLINKTNQKSSSVTSLSNYQTSEYIKYNTIESLKIHDKMKPPFPTNEFNLKPPSSDSPPSHDKSKFNSASSPSSLPLNAASIYKSFSSPPNLSNTPKYQRKISSSFPHIFWEKKDSGHYYIDKDINLDIPPGLQISSNYDTVSPEITVSHSLIVSVILPSSFQSSSSSLHKQIEKKISFNIPSLTSYPSNLNISATPSTSLPTTESDQIHSELFSSYPMISPSSSTSSPHQNLPHVFPPSSTLLGKPSLSSKNYKSKFSTSLSNLLIPHQPHNSQSSPFSLNPSMTSPNNSSPKKKKFSLPSFNKNSLFSKKHNLVCKQSSINSISSFLSSSSSLSSSSHRSYNTGAKSFDLISQPNKDTLLVAKAPFSTINHPKWRSEKDLLNFSNTIKKTSKSDNMISANTQPFFSSPELSVTANETFPQTQYHTSNTASNHLKLSLSSITVSRHNSVPYTSTLPNTKTKNVPPSFKTKSRIKSTNTMRSSANTVIASKPISSRNNSYSSSYRISKCISNGGKIYSNHSPTSFYTCRTSEDTYKNSSDTSLNDIGNLDKSVLTTFSSIKNKKARTNTNKFSSMPSLPLDLSYTTNPSQIADIPKNSQPIPTATRNLISFSNSDSSTTSNQTSNPIKSIVSDRKYATSVYSSLSKPNSQHSMNTFPSRFSKSSNSLLEPAPSFKPKFSFKPPNTDKQPFTSTPNKYSSHNRSNLKIYSASLFEQKKFKDANVSSTSSNVSETSVVDIESNAADHTKNSNNLFSRSKSESTVSVTKSNTDTTITNNKSSPKSIHNNNIVKPKILFFNNPTYSESLPSLTSISDLKLTSKKYYTKQSSKLTIISKAPSTANSTPSSALIDPTKNTNNINKPVNLKPVKKVYSKNTNHNPSELVNYASTSTIVNQPENLEPAKKVYSKSTNHNPSELVNYASTTTIVNQPENLESAKKVYSKNHSSQALTTRENSYSAFKSTKNSNDPSKAAELIKSSTLSQARSSTDSTFINKFYRPNNFSKLSSSKPPPKPLLQTASSNSKLMPTISKKNSIKSQAISIKSQNNSSNLKNTAVSEKKVYQSSKSKSYSKTSSEISYHYSYQNKSPSATPVPFKRKSKKLSMKFPSSNLSSGLNKPQNLTKDSSITPDRIDKINDFPQSHSNINDFPQSHSNINNPQEISSYSKKKKFQPKILSKSRKLSAFKKKTSFSSYSIKSNSNSLTREFYLDNANLATSKFDLNFEKDKSLDFNFEFNKDFELGEQFDFNKYFLPNSQSISPNASKGGDLIIDPKLIEIDSDKKQTAMNDPLSPPLSIPAISPNYSDSSQLSSPTLKEYVIIKKKDTLDYQSLNNLDQVHKTSKLLKVFKAASSSKSDKRSSAPVFNSSLSLKSCRKFSISSSSNNKDYRPFSIHNFDFTIRYTQIFPNDQNNIADPTMNDYGYAIIQQVKSS
ncbi:hypothetical protein AYI70_g1273, partial [Smittium culicis]